MILDEDNGYLGLGFIWTGATVATVVVPVTGQLCFEAVEVAIPWIDAADAAIPFIDGAQIGC